MPVKQHSKDLSGLFTEATRSRKSSPLKTLLKYMAADPTLISLGAGLPHPDTFAFSEVSAKVAQPGRSVKVSGSDLLDVKVSSAKGRVTESVSQFLQYGNGRGVASYVEFAREHTENIHNPLYEDWDVIMTGGNTDGFSKVVTLFCERGNTVVVDEWTYPAVMETLKPLGLSLSPVAMDSEGMIPEKLDALCSSCADDANAPRAVYLIPTAQNPTGATMSLERRQRIYEVAQKHNLVLIEDDPYYYLQFGAFKPPIEGADPEERYSDLPGLSGLVPSLLSLDTDGRVIRLDSFSKVLAPGLRCGWVTAPKYITDKLQFQNECSTQQASGLSQGIVSKLMNEIWGHSGWEKHLIQTQREYAIRRDKFVDLCEKYLSGLVEYTVPDSGMFVWFRINLNEESRQRSKVMRDMFKSMIDNHVMLVPGYFFAPEGITERTLSRPYVRASFSYASIDQFEAAVSRFAQAIKPFTQ